MIIKDKAKLKKIINSAKKSGQKVLVKRGVFDLIHPGHIYAIREFTKRAAIVVILVMCDKLAKQRKGKLRPVNKQRQRLEVIDGLKGVDYVFPEKSATREEYIKFLKYLKPSIVAVTSAGQKKTKAYTQPEWEIIEFPDKKKSGYSTTEIINKIRKR